MTGRVIETIPELFDHAVDTVPDVDWVITDDGTWTFGDAARHVDRLAVGLTAAGVAEGDRVIVTARNETRYLFTWIALMQLGAVQVPLNPASSAAEVGGFVGQVRPVAIITDCDLRALHGSRCPATSRSSTSCHTHRPAASPSPNCHATATTGRSTPMPDPDDPTSDDRTSDGRDDAWLETEERASRHYRTGADPA